MIHNTPKIIQGTYYRDKMEGRKWSTLRWEHRSSLMTHNMTQGRDWLGLGGVASAYPRLACRGQRSQTKPEARSQGGASPG